MDFAGRVKPAAKKSPRESKGPRFSSLVSRRGASVHQKQGRRSRSLYKGSHAKLKDVNVRHMNNVRRTLLLRSDRMMQRFNETMRTCTTEGKWPPLNKFDLVISWWTNRKQSDMHPKNASSLLQQSSLSGFENQAEIKYALRSFEKYGLLDHVGTVHLLLDAAVVDKHGLPRFFNYSKANLRIITDRDLGVEDTAATSGTKWRKFLSIDKIPGLSEYFLWLPDDNIMMKPFKKEFLYHQDKPLLYSYGKFSLGWCDSMEPVGSTHGPVLFQKCAFQAVANHYWRSPDSLGRQLIGKAIDVPCLYDKVMTYFWRQMGRNVRFHNECHTNSNSPTGCSIKPKNPPLFVNLQGPGISDEYIGGDARDNPGARDIMPKGVASFFHDKFPQPSQFEPRLDKQQILADELHRLGY